MHAVITEFAKECVVNHRKWKRFKAGDISHKGLVDHLLHFWEAFGVLGIVFGKWRNGVVGLGHQYGI